MTLYLSERLEPLVDRLVEEMSSLKPMETRTVLVPNSQMRQWLLLEIAKKKGIAMGLKVLEVERFFSLEKSSLEIFCLIYSALLKTQDPEILSYLGGKKKRLIELSSQLSSLFFKYSQYGLSLEESWQKKLFQQIFKEKSLEVLEPIICFGIDFLPSRYWEALLRAPVLSVYLFSPCQEFWEDLCSDKERKRIWKKAPKKLRSELDSYLREGPRNLANWGRLGRLALKHFEDLQTEELYDPIEPTSLLKQVQSDLLTFKETKEPKIDTSIQVFLTGTSRLREVEALKEEILRSGIPYHEISVLAPNMEPYVPLIEYVFTEIPYRISGFDIGSRSSYRQGLMRLLALGSSRWDVEDVLSLFETPSFYRKKGWDRDVLERLRNWISSAEIKWGLDQTHREKKLQEMLVEKESIDGGSWEKGFDFLLNAIVYLKPMQIESDLFEELLSTFSELQTLGLKGERSLFEWADSLEKAVDTFLSVDPEDEADAAFQNRFRALLLEMKKCSSEELYPFEVVQRFLMLPCKSQLNSSKLHAIRFMSMEEGAQIPAKALFLIGMDEMSFPKAELASSLDLLKGKAPKQADIDRYLFLQAIFSTKESLRISYGHLSATEGKPVGPSSLVQELFSITGAEITHIYPQPLVQEAKKHLCFPGFTTVERPVGEITLSIHELRQLARHPWKFFVQKAHQIYLDGELKETFALQRAGRVREFFEKGVLSEGELPRPFQKAMESEVLEKIEERRAQLKEWELEPFSLHFKEHCEQKIWDGRDLSMPPLELAWENLKIRLVGEIKWVTEKGMISTQEDTLAGTLKVWPEALAVAAALSTEQIWLLRNGKNRTIRNPYESLKAFIEYYFHALKSPSPLLSEWVDPLLRKEAADLAKKIAQGFQFEDPVIDWVFAKAQIPPAEEIFASWSPFLRKSLQGLREIYSGNLGTHLSL